jgi:hypothetical protein
MIYDGGRGLLFSIFKLSLFDGRQQNFLQVLSRRKALIGFKMQFLAGLPDISWYNIPKLY